jgi:hypothetical protein
MKNKFLVAFMIVVSLAATHSSYALDTTPKGPVYETVIGDFIDSFMNSNYKKLDAVLSENACVKIPRIEKVIIQDRASLIRKMREDSGVKQNCTSSYEVIAQSGAMVIVRVDFQYDNFKQQNYVVMEKNNDQQWKITEISKFSLDNDRTTNPQNVVAVNKQQ